MTTVPSRIAAGLAAASFALALAAAGPQVAPLKSTPAQASQSSSKAKAKPALAGTSKPVIADGEFFEITLQAKDLPASLNDSDVKLSLSKFNENFDLNTNLKVKLIKKTKKKIEAVNIRTKAKKIKEFSLKKDVPREDDTLTVTIVSFTAGDTADVSVEVGD